MHKNPTYSISYRLIHRSNASSRTLGDEYLNNQICNSEIRKFLSFYKFRNSKKLEIPAILELEKGQLREQSSEYRSTSLRYDLKIMDHPVHLVSKIRRCNFWRVARRGEKRKERDKRRRKRRRKVSSPILECWNGEPAFVNNDERLIIEGAGS